MRTAAVHGKAVFCQGKASELERSRRTLPQDGQRLNAILDSNCVKLARSRNCAERYRTEARQTVPEVSQYSSVTTRNSGSPANEGTDPSRGVGLG
jgi:hypothetical protein